MTVFEAIVQGVIQGATEFLPVSSSGHLSISQHMFGLELPGILFDVMLHLGTLLAVIFVYRSLIWRLILEFVELCKDVFHRRFKWSEMNQDRRLLMMLIVGLLPLFLLFLPIPGTDMRVKDLSEMLATDGDIIAEGVALMATSCLLFVSVTANRRMQEMRTVGNSRRRVTRGRSKIHTFDALLIGLAQCFAAIFPGLSRSGSTLATGLMRKINRQTALDYSFVLGIPAIAAATLLSLKDLGSDGVQIGAVPLLVGMLTAAVVGFLAIRLLRWIVTTDRLAWFGYYTFVIGLAVIIIGIIEHATGQNLFTGMPL